MSGEIRPVEENGAEPGGYGESERIGRIVALGRALSDPIRVRMLGMMAGGRSCCDFPDLGAPVLDADAGICVCEFEDQFGMGQSRISYHVRKLKEAGLVREERRGRWSFYSLEDGVARELLADVEAHLSPARSAKPEGRSAG